MIKLLQYDFIYLKRTYKFLIFPIVASIFGFLSPLAAKYVNELLKLVTTGQEGMPIFTLPDPVVTDSYAQFASNMFEVFLIVVIFVSVSVFMKDKNKGLLPLILSKPINRTKYLLSKFVSLGIVVLGSIVIGSLLFTYSTYFIFDEVDFGIVLSFIGLYFVYIVLMLSVSLFFSQFTKNYATASIFTFIAYVVLSISSAFQKGILDYFPGRIITRITEVILGGDNSADIIITVLVTLLFSAVLVYVSLIKFKKYDL